LQTGIRLAFVRIRPQMRHGAANSTDVTASSEFLRITRKLLTKEIQEEATSKIKPKEEFQEGASANREPQPEPNHAKAGRWLKLPTDAMRYSKPCSFFSWQVMQ
jgi:hypothetical protein